MEVVLILPEESVATTVIMFTPSVKVILAFQFVVPVARMPFTVIFRMSILSDAVPETVTVLLMEVVPSVGDGIVTDGEVVSDSRETFISQTSAAPAP